MNLHLPNKKVLCRNVAVDNLNRLAAQGNDSYGCLEIYVVSFRQDKSFLSGFGCSLLPRDIYDCRYGHLNKVIHTFHQGKCDRYDRCE